MIYLGWDLEAVIDADLARRCYGMTGTDREVRQQVRERTLEKSKGKTEFPKPVLWRVVALGMAAYNAETGSRKVQTYAGPGESEMLLAFYGAQDKLSRPTWFTANGRGFDFPVILHRGFALGLPLGAFFGDTHEPGYKKRHYRYDGSHIDILDALTGFGGATQASLHELAIACGMEGKGGVDGSRVEELYEGAQWDTLKGYVADDAEKTLALGLRLEELRGRLPKPTQIALGVA